MKHLPIGVGTAAAALCFVVTCIVQVYSIQQSASSTAALGYVLLPFVALLSSCAAFGLGWLWGSLVPASRSSRWRVPRLYLACLSAAALVLWTASEVSEWMAVRRMVAQVHYMTGEQLRTLIGQPGLGRNRFVLGAIAESPRATPEVLHQIVLMNRKDLYRPLRAFLPVPSKNRKGIAVMRLVAANPSTTAEDLNWLATNSDDERLLGVLARRSEVNLGTLRKLADTGASSVAFGLAANPKAPADLPERLAGSESEYTRANVTGNPAAPASILRVLSADPVAHVRLRVAMNPATPDAVRAELTKDSDLSVRRVAAEQRPKD